MSSRLSRRQLLKSTAAATAAVALANQRIFAADAPAIVSDKSPNKKLNCACIGAGGRGGAHVGECGKENIVALCDVDKRTLGKAGEKHPTAKTFTDYRKMFDAMSKDIDAVFVATPDHNHAAASMLAVTAGKACYTEKPLTWSVNEARVLAQAAAEKKIPTQMGNQGHAGKGIRMVVQWIRDGAIGDVKEVHTWTNRPVWPQGNLERGAAAPVPEWLDWDSWIGPAEMREYTEINGKDRKGKEGARSPYLPFSWRGWFDYGCGAVGDMGCHTWDNVFWAMNPDYPSYVELLEVEEPGNACFAKKSKFKWEFPAKQGRAAFTALWYSGGLKPAVPEELTADDPKRTLPGSGNLYIGTKGKLLVSGDYADSPRLIPESFMKSYHEETKGKESKNAIEPSPGHHQEFFMAAKGEKPWNFPKSNWVDSAGPLTEVMLLGCIAEKIGKVGFKIECNPEKREILTKEGLALASRAYRSGYKLI